MMTVIGLVLFLNVMFVMWRVWVAQYYPRRDDLASEAEAGNASLVYLDKVETSH